MDVTPQLLTEVKFREEWRGYNRDEVDHFLERLAVALQDLQSRFDQVSDRASRAEQQLLETNNEDQVRRTLVLAQRTADAALEEARAEAERMVNDAEEHARATMAEAEERAALLEADAASRTQAELGSLAARRAELSAEAEALADFVAEHRGRLQAELHEQLAWLSKPGRLELPAPPVLSPLPFPASQEHHDGDGYAAEGDWSDGFDEGWEEAEPAPWEDQEPAEPFRGLVEAPEPERHVGEPTGEVYPVGVNGSNGRSQTGNGHYGNGNGNGYAAEYGNGNGNGGGYAADTHLLNQPVDDPRDIDMDLGIDDDPFLAELRRAVTDTEPLGPRDDEPDWDAGARADDDFSTSDLFGRKRRR